MSNYGPDVGYVLDGAIEFLEMTPDMPEWIYTYDPDIDWNVYMEEAGSVEMVVRDFEQWWHNDASLIQKCMIVASVVQSQEVLRQFNTIRSEILDKKLNSVLHETMGLSPVEEFTVASINYGPKYKITKENYKKVRKLTKREIAKIDDEFQSKLEIMSERVQNYGRLYQNMIVRFQEVVDEAGTSENFCDLVYAAHEERTRMAQHQHTLDQIRQHIIYPDEDYVDVSEQKRVTAVQRKELTTAKKVLKRSVNTLTNFIGEQNVHLFFAKKYFEVSGEKYTFRISKKEHFNLIQNAGNPTCHYIPYKLELFTRNGQYLAEGCVVFPNAPAFDQITALCLSIQAGQENHIVKVTNWFKVCDRFYSYTGHEKPKPRIRSDYSLLSADGLPVVMVRKSITALKRKKTKLNAARKKMRKQYDDLRNKYEQINDQLTFMIDISQYSDIEEVVIDHMESNDGPITG